MAEIKFSPKDIFEQDFKTTMRGYNKEEVDEFLDDVIRDYETYASLVADLQAENAKLKEELEKKQVVAQKAQVAPKAAYAAPQAQTVAKPEAPRPATATTAVTNFDILKRISRLEKEVFGKQIVE